MPRSRKLSPVLRYLDYDFPPFRVKYHKHLIRLDFCTLTTLLKGSENIYFYLRINQHRPPLWSSGQSSWLQIRRPGFDSRHYHKKSSGSGTGSTQPREYN
jgi:hypothetical protein